MVFDGSVCLTKAVTRFVLRNEARQPVRADAFYVDGATISLAEVIALKEGFSFARRKGMRKLVVEGDSKLII